MKKHSGWAILWSDTDGLVDSVGYTIESVARGRYEQLKKSSRIHSVTLLHYEDGDITRVASTHRN